jgi:hypothetical protein
LTLSPHFLFLQICSSFQIQRLAMSISIALDQITDVVKNADTRTTALAVAAATAGWWGVVSTQPPFVCGLLVQHSQFVPFHHSNDSTKLLLDH